MSIDVSEDLLEILVCPVCRTALQPVEYAPEQSGLQCTQCRRIYPVREGIPVMLLDEAIESSP